MKGRMKEYEIERKLEKTAVRNLILPTKKVVGSPFGNFRRLEALLV
jgi:hypothetical protein